MKIEIKPFSQHVPQRGMMRVTHAIVGVARLELGIGARGTYELKALEQRAGEDKPREITVSSGAVDLTSEQFAAWGADDTHFAHCVLSNAGVELAEKAQS